MSKPKILPENRDRVIKSACALCNEVFKENFGSAVCGADGSTTITAPISVSYVMGRGVTAHIRMADRRAEDAAPVLTRYRVGVVADDSDWTAVEEAAMQFVKSVAEGNSQYARELFTDEAVLFGYLDGKLEHGSIEQFYHNVDTVAAGENFKARVDVLLLEETLAVVRVLEEGWGGRIDFTDYLLLLKIDGEWRCVAKAYNQNSNTIQK